MNEDEDEYLNADFTLTTFLIILASMMCFCFVLWTLTVNAHEDDLQSFKRAEQDYFNNYAIQLDYSFSNYICF